MNRQIGMTITELMVAMLVGMFLILGAGQVFVSSKRTYTMQEGLSRVQENGRFAMEMMSRTVRLAGYMGCLRGTTLHNNLNNPGQFAYNFSVGLEGYDFNGTGIGDAYDITATDPAPAANGALWSPNLPAALVGQAIPGSDVIVTRFVSPNPVPLVSPFNNSAQVFVAMPNDLSNDEILVITDCAKASVFQATNTQVVGGGTSKNVVHASSGTPGNSVAVWPLPEQQYGPGAEITRAESYAYFVGRGAGGGPSLFQARLATVGGTANLVIEELVEGVENMQVVYGVDTSGNQQINAYVSGDNVANWENVIAARITLLVRTVDTVQSDMNINTYNVNGTVINPVDDQRQRRVFSTTITLRNRAQ